MGSLQDPDRLTPRNCTCLPSASLKKVVLLVSRIDGAKGLMSLNVREGLAKVENEDSSDASLGEFGVDDLLSGYIVVNGIV